MVIKKEYVVSFTLGVGLGVFGMMMGSSDKSSEQETKSTKVSQQDKRVSATRKNKKRSKSTNTQAVSNLFSGQSSNNYSDMFEQAKSSGNNVYRDHLLKVLVMEWSKVDPAYALDMVTGMESERNDLLHIILEQQALSDSKAAISWLDSNVKDPQRHSYLMTSVLKSVATNNPNEALTMAKGLPKGSDQTNALSTVLDQWVQNDPKSALAWISKEPMNQQIMSVYTSAMHHYVNTDAGSAAKLIKNMENSSLKTSLTAECARKFAQEDLSSALEWADTITDSDAHNQALLNVVEEWSRQSPSDALAYVVEKADDPSFGNIVRQTAITLANDDPVTLIENLESLPAQHQPFASERIAQALFRVDSETAMQWIDILPQGEAKGRVIKEAVNYYSSFSPIKALDLAESTGAQHQREENVRDVLKNWSKVNFAQARDALDATTALNYDQKVRLLDDMRSTAQSISVVLPD